jgi:hypothetical protein
MWYAYLNIMVGGLTNGIIGTYVMIAGCGSSKQAEVGGYIMAFHLTIGLALGSVTAALLSYVLI